MALRPPSDVPNRVSSGGGDSAPPEPDPDALVGRFLGPYLIVRHLSTGGMGSVYLADHAALDRKVALKVLSAPATADRVALERFFREARAAAALDHPHIVRIFDRGSTGGLQYLVMEYVAGDDLQSVLDRDGPLPFREAVRCAAQAAAGLQHAHERGFVHRDVKPANLIRTPDGTVKVLDMGLARPFGEAAPRDQVTERVPGAWIAGTVDFVSPEQALNGRLDARTDVYSLGATLHALLTGAPPFAGTAFEKLKLVQFQDPPSVTAYLGDAVPEALAAVVARMMAKRPSARYATANEVIAALAPWLPPGAAEALISDPKLRAELQRRSGRSRRRALAVLAAGVLAAAVLAVSVGLRDRAAGPDPDPEAPVAFVLEGHKVKANDLVFEPTGGALASVDVSGRLMVWDARTGARLHAPAPFAPNGRCWACALGPNGTVLTGGNRQPVLAFGWAAGTAVREYAAHAPAVTGLATAPNGSRVYLSGSAAEVVALDAATGAEVLRLPTGARLVWSVAVSPDGALVAAGTGAGDEGTANRVIVWRAADGKELFRLAGHADNVRSVAFRPDGRALVTAGFDGTVRVWDLETGREALKVAAHEGFVERAFFLPDGKRLISCGGPEDGAEAVTEAGSVKVWDATTGRELRAWRGPEWRDLVSLAVAPDGRSFATGARNGIVRLCRNHLDP